MKMPFSNEKARAIGQKIGIDFDRVDLQQFRCGLAVELESTCDKVINVTSNDLHNAAKTAENHLMTSPDYYADHEIMEQATAAGKSFLK